MLCTFKLSNYSMTTDNHMKTTAQESMNIRLQNMLTADPARQEASLDSVQVSKTITQNTRESFKDLNSYYNQMCYNFGYQSVDG